MDENRVLADFLMFTSRKHANDKDIVLTDKIELILDKELKKLQDSINNAYKERNMLVAYIASLFPSHLKEHPKIDTSWDDEWRTIICVHSPMGQMTWHLHDIDKSFFEFLTGSTNQKQFEDCEWDGHTTEEKYKRLLSAIKPPE